MEAKNLDTYSITASCSNCKNSNAYIKVPMGVLVSDYLKVNKKCPYCGCATLYGVNPIDQDAKYLESQRDNERPDPYFYGSSHFRWGWDGIKPGDGPIYDN